MTKTVAPLTLNEAIHDVRKANHCLYISLPEDVADDVKRRTETLITTIQSREKFQTETLRRLGYRIESLATQIEDRASTVSDVLDLRRIAAELFVLVGQELKMPGRLVEPAESRQNPPDTAQQ